jgi:hypothetical protein
MDNYNSSPAVTDCVFTDNSAMHGGGMYNSSGSPTVTNCTFSGNIAYEPFDYVGDGGGMYNHNSSPAVTDCTFSGNLALNRAGGMYNSSGSPTVTNCTFSGNSAALGRAWAFNSFQQQYPANLIMTNCILWDGGNGIWNNDGSTISITYSDVQGGWSGDGNLDADPMFVQAPPDSDCCSVHPTPGCADPACEAMVCDVAPWCCGSQWSVECAQMAEDVCGDLCSLTDVDLQLLPSSPCIDAGHNNAVADLTDTDLDGNPRCADDPATADTGCGVPVVVDMGAYEYQGEPAVVVYADMTGDGLVGLDDFDTLMGCWSSFDEPCCVADLDLDGTVGVVDFLLLLANWSP